MADSNIVVGVDIGSSKVSTLIGKIEDDTINILGVSEVPSKGIRKGQIVDIEEAASSINASLDAAERMAGYSIGKVFVSISGVHIESQNSKGIVAISAPQGEISEADVGRVLEAAGAVSLPSTSTIIHVLPKTFTVDGEGGIKDPVGMTGVRLEVDTHIVTAITTSTRNIDRVFMQEAGVGINALVFSGLASSLAVLTDTEKELGVILVDIGAGITNICIFVDGALSYSSVIPIGARHITNDLAIGLRISLESAEKIKLHLSSKYGKNRNEEHEESGDEIDLTDLRLSEDLKKVSKKTLIDGIIRPRLNELFTMIGIELKKSGFATQTPAGLVVTGGGARTVGVQESAKRMLSMPVRIGVPSNLTGLIDDVENPSFATAVGLISYGRNFAGRDAGGGGIEGIFSFIPSGSFGSMGHKVKKLLKNFIP
jgi:cell division protein FtsA